MIIFQKKRYVAPTFVLLMAAHYAFVGCHECYSLVYIEHFYVRSKTYRVESGLRSLPQFVKWDKFYVTSVCVYEATLSVYWHLCDTWFTLPSGVKTEPITLPFCFIVVEIPKSTNLKNI